MTGQKNLIEMRMRGVKPACVCLYDFPFDTDWAKWGDLPRVTVHKDKIIDLDLRFVVGMTVMIESHDKGRAKNLFEKCINDGASIVAASAYPCPMTDPCNRVKSETLFYFKDNELF